MWAQLVAVPNFFPLTDSVLDAPRSSNSGRRRRFYPPTSRSSFGQLDSQAQRIKESIATPFQQYSKAIAEADVQQQRGAISQASATAAKNATSALADATGKTREAARDTQLFQQYLKDLASEGQRVHEDLVEQAKRIHEEVETPLEKYQEQVASVNALYKSGRCREFAGHRQLLTLIEPSGLVKCWIAIGRWTDSCYHFAIRASWFVKGG